MTETDRCDVCLRFACVCAAEREHEQAEQEHHERY